MPLTLAVVEYYARLIEAGKEYSETQRRLASGKEWNASNENGVIALTPFSMIRNWRVEHLIYL